MPRVPPSPRKPIIGLTGSIGAGKTTVALILESLGAAVIDSDRLAHEELQDPEVVATILDWWGPVVCSNGTDADRRAIAGIVFRDARELARLEGLLYPRLARKRQSLLALYQADPMVSAIVVDAPKLYEAGLHGECDVVIFVDADRSVRLQRLRDSRGWSPEELDRRENFLEPLDKRQSIADYIVVNHAGTAELQAEIKRIFDLVLDGTY